MAASVTGEGIVVAGEALVDLVTGPEPGEIAARLGGGPFNTARTLGRLEQPVRFLGAVSSDAYGRQIRADLAADGVSLDALVETDAPTTLAVAELDSGGVATYRFYTQGTSAPAVTAEAALAAAGRPAALHVGTLGLVLEPLAGALEQLVAAVTGRALVMVDPNVRPGVIADEGAYRDRLGRVLAGADVVKVSVDDLDWLAPGMTPLDGARSLLAQGPRAALVTAGAQGALAVTATEEAPVAAPPVTVVDTIGAGDAFGGGFLAWWTTGGLGREDLGDLTALRRATGFASLVAGLTCTHLGAVPPRLADVQALAAGLQRG